MKKESPNIDDLVTCVENQLAFTVNGVTPIKGGFNNKLFKLDTDQEVMLAKFYYQDDRQRLQREYGAFKFLHEEGIESVPRAFLIDTRQSFAIYSYEPGQTKKGKNLEEVDLDNIINFVVDLHKFSPSKVDAPFGSAVLATFSFREFIEGAKFRIERFEAYLNSDNLHPRIADFVQNSNYREQIGDTINKISGRDFDIPIITEQKRLSPVDFGPHNMLFDKQNIKFIDFEYFGWDDPIKLISNFIHHGGVRGLSQEKKEYFLNRYKSVSPLPREILQRLDTALTLSAVDWLSILLWGITPEKINYRKFADPNFNEDLYIDQQTNQIQERLLELNL